jgi:CDP-ribitol ribitolphosphotransferase
VDVLTDREYAERKRAGIIERYPMISEKQNILYLPTLRSDEKELQEKADELIRSVDYDRYNLIVKPHPLSGISAGGGKALTCDEFSSEDMLFAADHVVADYSGMVFEALAVGKREYFYAFDYEEYEGARGWFIDYRKEIPGKILRSGAEVMKAIDDGAFDTTGGEAFFSRYVDPPRGASRTSDIAGMIMDLI